MVQERLPTRLFVRTSLDTKLVLAEKPGCPTSLLDLQLAVAAAHPRQCPEHGFAVRCTAVETIQPDDLQGYKLTESCTTADADLGALNYRNISLYAHLERLLESQLETAHGSLTDPGVAVPSHAQHWLQAARHGSSPRSHGGLSVARTEAAEDQAGGEEAAPSLQPVASQPAAAASQPPVQPQQGQTVSQRHAAGQASHSDEPPSKRSRQSPTRSEVVKAAAVAPHILATLRADSGSRRQQQAPFLQAVAEGSRQSKHSRQDLSGAAADIAAASGQAARQGSVPVSQAAATIGSQPQRPAVLGMPSRFAPASQPEAADEHTAQPTPEAGPAETQAARSGSSEVPPAAAAEQAVSEAVADTPAKRAASASTRATSSSLEQADVAELQRHAAPGSPPQQPQPPTPGPRSDAPGTGDRGQQGAAHARPPAQPAAAASSSEESSDENEEPAGAAAQPEVQPGSDPVQKPGAAQDSSSSSSEEESSDDEAAAPEPSLPSQQAENLPAAAAAGGAEASSSEEEDSSSKEDEESQPSGAPAAATPGATQRSTGPAVAAKPAASSSSEEDSSSSSSSEDESGETAAGQGADAQAGKPPQAAQSSSSEEEDSSSSSSSSSDESEEGAAGASPPKTAKAAPVTPAAAAAAAPAESSSGGSSSEEGSSEEEGSTESGAGDSPKGSQPASAHPQSNGKVKGAHAGRQAAQDPRLKMMLDDPDSLRKTLRDSQPEELSEEDEDEDDGIVPSKQEAAAAAEAARVAAIKRKRQGGEGKGTEPPSKKAAGSKQENGKVGPPGQGLANGTPDPAPPNPKEKGDGGAIFASKAKAAAAAAQQQAAQQARDASKPGGAAKQKAGGAGAQRSSPAAGAPSGAGTPAASGQQEPRSGKKATPARPRKGSGAELGPEGQLLQDASGHTIYPAADALTVAQLTKACNQLLRDVVSVESGGAKKRLDYNGDTPEWWPRDIPFGPLAKNRARAAQVYTAGLKQLNSLQD